MTDQTMKACVEKCNLGNYKNWQRLLYMVLFALLLHLASAVMWVLCALQFLFVLMTGQDNSHLRHLGGSISIFVHQSLQYLSYNSETKPFPFSDWPSPGEVAVGVSVLPSVNNSTDGGNEPQSDNVNPQ
jgi:hypothetical protein